MGNVNIENLDYVDPLLPSEIRALREILAERRDSDQNTQRVEPMLADRFHESFSTDGSRTRALLRHIIATHPSTKTVLGAISTVDKTEIWGLTAWQKTGLSLSARFTFKDGSARTYHITQRTNNEPVASGGSLTETENRKATNDNAE